MGILNWFEKKLFLCDIIQDYGDIQTKTSGITKIHTSVLPCKKNDKVQLVFRNIGTAPLGASVNYTPIDITPS